MNELNPPSGVRDQQKQQIQWRILESALILLNDRGEEALTIDAVAKAAEVTSRTVFRHFKNRELLLLAAWVWVSEQLESIPPPATANALIRLPFRLFPQIQHLGGVVIAYLHRRQRRVGRRRPDPQEQTVLLGCLRQALGHLDEPTLRRRAAIAQVLISPSAFEVMQESWGLNADEAARATAEALEILLNRRFAGQRDEGQYRD
jgi:AcrR family transcriptional regulator